MVLADVDPTLPANPPERSNAGRVDEPGPQGAPAPVSRRGDEEADAGAPLAPPTSDDAGAESGAPEPQGGACSLSICLTGAINQSSGANDAFSALCDDARLGDVVQDCDSGRCYSSFDTFPSKDVGGAYAALFAALDANRDGRVDDADKPCSINVLGFSWGGMNAVRLAQRLVDDARVSPSVRIEYLVMLDAYQPFAASPLVPARVRHSLSFRHSIAPRLDCSRSAPLGPYLGLSPRCPAGQDCADYDFSRSPETMFPLYRRASSAGREVPGRDVEHCDVSAAAHEAVIAMLNGRAYAGLLPAVVPVRP